MRTLPASCSLRDKATNFARLGASIGSAVIFGSIFRGLGRSQVAVQNRMGLLQVVAVQTAMSTVSKVRVDSVAWPHARITTATACSHGTRLGFGCRKPRT